MRYWVGVTDNNWFQHLAQRQFDEVNFWQPSAKPLFTNLQPGTPFLFKVKRPHNHIAGGGFFVKYSTLPLNTAWEAFGQKNGADTLDQLDRLIRPLSPDPKSPTLEIGCTVLTAPFFLPRDQWIPMPDDWSTNIVRGKTYDTVTPEGAHLWALVQANMTQPQTGNFVAEPQEVYGARYGDEFLTRSRLGQGAFRVLVTEAYNKRCAITGESTLPVLEAAHIKPFALEGPNSTSNGLLLRSDFHKLFDLGLVTVTPELDVLVSKRIKDLWYNGKAYYRLHGEKMAVIPTNPTERPNKDYLQWHLDTRFAE